MNDAAADGEVVVIAPSLLARDFLARGFFAPEMAHSSFFVLLCSEVAGSHQFCLQECFHCRRPK
jgi:hypothetical protein